MKSSTNRGGHNANPLFSAFIRALLPVMLLLVGNVAVKAQTEQSDFEFNDNVRYSQWVINSRLNSFYANTTEVGLAVYNEAGTQKAERNDGKTTLDYVPGLVAKGVIEAAQYYSAYPWAKPWFLSVADYGNAFYNTTEQTGGSLDNLNAVKLFITLSELANTSGAFAGVDAKAYTNANTAIDRAIKGLAAHNANYSIKAGTLAGDDVIGGWFHKYNSSGKYNNQMWLDGQYMGTALLAQISKFNGSRKNISSSTDDFEIVYNQLKMVWDKCWNSTDKLMYHAFDANAGTKSESYSDTWAGLSSTEPYVFHSQTYWARACGWYFLALVDVLEAMESVKNDAKYSAKYNEIKGWMTSLADGLEARQDSETGGWYQILDKDDTYSASTYNNNSYTETYNYIESSATAIFAAAYLKAVNLGYLTDTKYENAGKNAYKCIVNNFFASDGKGGVNIFGSCRSAGLGGKDTDAKAGGTKFRDGSNAYYLLGYDVARVAKSENKTEGKVLGAFILAATEYEKRYMSDKTVLLTQDLASSYELKAGGALTVGASGTVGSYQWYKDGTPVSGATEASYAPEENGSYYCVVTPATRAGESIKSTTAEVTVAENGTGTMLENLVSTAGVSGSKWTGTMTNGDIYATYTSSLSQGNYFEIAKNTSLTLTIPEGYTVTSLKITGASTGSSKTSPLTIGGETHEYSGTTLSYNEFTITSGTGPTTITIKTGTERVTRVAAIEVYGTKGGSTGTTGHTITYVMNGHGDQIPQATNATALPNPLQTPTSEGWTFIGWYTDVDLTNAAVAGTTLTGDVTLYAKWEKTYAVTVTTPTNGSIAVTDGNGTEISDLTKVAEGTKLVFTATAAEGYELESWTVNGTTVAATDDTYTIESLTAATTVTATFKAKDAGSSTGEGLICSFTDSKPSTPTMVEKVNGSYSTAKGTVTYKDTEYNTCLKMESSTDLKITLTESRSVTFVFAEANKGVEIDGTLQTTDANGCITLTLEAGVHHVKKGSGDGINLFAIDFGAASKSNETATTFATDAEHSLSGNTLTITHESADAGQTEKTITITKAKGATYELKAEDGISEAVGASLNNATITYTVPAANTSKTYKLNVTAEDGKTTDAYTIKIVTKPAPGTIAEYTGTFTLEQMKGFGSASGNKTILSDDEALKLEAYSGTESGKEVQNTNDDNKGARVQYSASFKLTPNAEGVKIKKVTLYTKRTFSLTSNPLVTAEPNAKDNTIWEYTFNSIDDAITFTNSTTNKSNIEVLRINVVYEKGVADGKTALSAKFDKDVLSWYVNDVKPTEPTLSVNAYGVENFDAYTVKYTSSNTDVVTVDATTGKLTQVGSGTAVITAEVQPTETVADKYVGTSVVYTVTVKPLEVPTVYAHDITVYNTTGVQPQPVVDIYVTDAEGNRVVLDKRYYELKYSVAKTEDNPNNIFVGTDGKFVLAGSAGDWTTGSAVVTVTCEPNAEAAKLYHITKANATFNVNVVETGGKLVPTFGGVKEAKMNAGSTREFVKAVLYGGVDITSGFTYNYEIATETGVTGSTVSATANNGTLSFKAGTLNDGVTEGKVTITITATPNTETEELYTQAIGTIVVTVGKYKDFKSVKVSPNKLEKNVGDVIQDFTVEVIDENGNPVAEDDYTMVWGSSAPGIVAVVGDRSQGIFTAVSEGEAIIRVYVSNGEYAEMKGECKVNVKDAGKSAVDANTEYKIGTEFPADGLTLTLGGWMFNGSVDGLKGKYGTTDEVLANATAKWGKPSSENNKPVGFTHNITMTDQKNARQEYGSNCQPESNGIYDGVITEQPTKVIDPMFNVPCYGAYFALAPKTTGTVTVYVRQNGVFDTDNGKHRYRPQRRVFVMDEKGGHVSSTPNLEFPTGWRPTSEDMTKFDCDLLGGITDLTKFENGNHTQEETVNWIKSHFVGLKDFAMGKANFKNGVYASNLPTSVTHNQAQISRTDEQIAADPSVRGWSVLSVAPVSYTFDVKPGKTYYIYNYGSKLGLYGFVFRKGTPTVDEVSYSETEAPTVEKTAPNHVAKVSIDREFKGGIWNACVLPFSMNRQQIGKVFGPCYDKDNPEGTQILYFDRVENGKIHFVRHAYNTIVAGKPFLIKPKFDKAVISSENMGDYPYVTIEAIDAEKFGKDYKTADYYWTSSYGKFSIKPGDYFIRDAISNSNGKPVSGNVVRYPKTMTTDYAMNGFRGYLTAKTDDLRNSAKSFTIGISDFENNETTYIENVEIAEDGTLRQRLSGKVYNLQGQLVSDDASQLNSLPKGIYIVNGTKVSVK